MIVDTDDLITAVEIAAIADVTPAAVWNWMQRHDDFPRPVVTKPRLALWLAPEVVAWLTTPRTVTVTRVVAPKVQR